MTTPQSTTLYFTSGSSDKEYRVELQEAEGGLWTVVAYNGKRGKANTMRPQTDAPMNYQAAKVIFDAVVAKKVKEGYVEDASGVSELADEVQRKKRVAALSKHIDADEGFFSGFRVPNDVILLPYSGQSMERVAECANEWDAGIVCNNFWMVHKDDTKAVVTWCEQEFQTMASNCDDDPEDVAGSMICVWGNPELSYQLVGTFSDIPDQLEGRSDNPFPAIDAWQIAFDGNDNGIEEMWRGVVDQGHQMEPEEQKEAFLLCADILVKGYVHDIKNGAPQSHQDSQPMAVMKYLKDVSEGHEEALDLLNFIEAQLSHKNLEDNLEGIEPSAAAKPLKI